METLDSDGNQTHSMEGMKLRAVEYFTNLYSVENRPLPLPNLNIRIEHCPSAMENAKLRAYPSVGEAWNSLKNMPNGKAPGMDGLTAEILVHHLDTIKEALLAAILHFFKTKKMLRSLNLTTITLIPKKISPERLEDYRPISC